METISLYNISTTPAKFAESLIYLDGKPLSFNGMNYMRTIINTDAEKCMIMSGRQVGKSTVSSTIITTALTSTPYFRTLYVAPRMDQVTSFSADKLMPMLRNSPLIAKYYIDSTCKQQVYLTSLLNGSACYLRSCYLNADGIRGLSINQVFLDEVQDLNYDDLPVIEECTARRNPKRLYYTGTPKTFDNTIQKLWDNSSQHYWALKCDACNTWNVPILLENLAPTGLICKKCGHSLTVSDGEYVAMHPDRKFIGYHISQAMVAGVPETGIPWTRLWEKVGNPMYSEAKFFNECLGFSYDNGAKLLVEADVRACCDQNMTQVTTRRKSEWGIYNLVAAVDWGVLGGNTHTVLTIGGLDTNGNVRIIFSKKYPVDQDPLTQMEDITKLIKDANVAIIVADRGGGSLANSVLRRNFPTKHVYEIEYKARVQAGMKYNAESKSWVTDRTRAIAGIVLDIKAKKIIFPAYKIMEDTFAPDLLTLMCEYNERTRSFQIIRDTNVTDDFAHTLVYLRLGAKFFLPNPHRTEFPLDEFQPPSSPQKDAEIEIRKGGYDIENNI